jgi:hypothetical protein
MLLVADTTLRSNRCLPKRLPHGATRVAFISSASHLDKAFGRLKETIRASGGRVIPCFRHACSN